MTYRDMYRDAAQQGTGALWKRVVVIRAAIESGEYLSKEAMLSDLGKEAGDSASQMKKYYAVAKVFNGIAIADDYDYWFYQACALALGVDPDNVETYAIAHDWLQFGFKDREIKRGKNTIRAKHSTDSLKRAIRAETASGKPKAEVVLKARCAVDQVFLESNQIMLWVEDNEEALKLLEEFQETPTEFTVTITRQPQPALADAASEKAVVA